MLAREKFDVQHVWHNSRIAAETRETGGKGETCGIRVCASRAHERLADIFSILLVLRQPGSRRSIHNREPSKESLRQINVVPDLSQRSRSSCRHRIPRDQGAVYTVRPFEHDGASG
jgi:hypothetical protein